jgi:hypothetical protein
VTDSLSKNGATLDKLAKPVAWRIFRNGHWWVAMPVVFLGLFGVSYFSIKSQLEDLMITRIAQQFEEPRIRETLQEVAESQASKILLNEIQPAVDRFRADLQNEYQTVSEEVSRIRIQNNLQILGDKAISEYDREAYEEIIRVAKTAPENSPLKRAAIEEMRRVKAMYTGSNYSRLFRLPSLTVTLEDGAARKDQDVPTTRLLISLSDPDWKVRTASVRLLGARREKGVPDALLLVARTDKNLSVVRFALSAFNSITRPGVKAFIQEDQYSDIFDVNKADQWWKEHSAEVHERLADMK